MKTFIYTSLILIGLAFVSANSLFAQNTLNEGGWGGQEMIFMDDESPEKTEMDDQLRLLAYPSPAQGDQIEIKYSNLVASSTLTVYDANGRPVYAEKVGSERDNTGVLSMSIQGLPSGFYIVKLVSGQFETMQKILVQR
jgi:hypothetical protein